MFSPGGVRPVKPFKKVRQLLRRDRGALIGDLKLCVAVRLLEIQLDGRALCPVFDGVVQKNGDCLLQLVKIAVDRDIRVDGRIVQRFPRLKRHRFKKQGAIRDRVGQRDSGKHGGTNHVVRPGQRQHLLHQRFHLPGLRLDVVRPTGGAGIERDGVHQLRIGENDRQRCFQLVGRVGQELVLLLPGALHRAGDPPGQKDRNAQKQY
ncbi:hypothetical protein SDC9_116761 [bioreactor metagenome]|uniref:Uncharacterized protein n=1 Tax=bioreactor metagenome TaxID=1076179 RepID=A0A645C397_9ZZZZ